MNADPFKDAQDRGIALYQSGSYKEAAASFEEASKSPNKDTAASAYYSMGVCQIALSDFPQAISWFERAIAIDPKDVFSLENLTLVCFDDRETYEKGFVYARRAEELFSERPEVYYNLACYYGSKGDAADALKYVDAAISEGFEDLDFMAAEADLAVVKDIEPYKTFERNFASVRRMFSLYDKAEALLKNGKSADVPNIYGQAIEACRIALGKDSLTEAGFLSAEGFLYLGLGKYPQAMDVLTKELAIQRKRRAAPHPDMATNRQYFGTALFRLRRFDEAIASYQEALSIQLETLGEGSSALATTYTYLGGAYSAKGNYPRAAEFLSKVPPLIDASESEGVKERATAEERLGAALLFNNEFEKAKAAYERSLAARLGALGPDHPDVARIYRALAGVESYAGKYAEAEELYRKALSIQEKALGPANGETISTQERLGDLFCLRGEFDEALALYGKDLENIKRSSGESSIEAAQCYVRLGSATYSLGQYATSISYYEKARAIWEKAMGPGYPEAARCLSGLAANYYSLGSYDEAIAAYSGSLDIQRRAYGEDNLDVAKGYLGLGLSYNSKGEYPKAVRQYETAAAIQKKLQGEASPDLARSYMNLSAAYSAMGDNGNAETYIVKCMTIQDKVYGPRHLDISVSLKMAGNIFLASGSHEDAIASFQKALEIQVQALGYSHQQVAETLNNLGAAYARWGAYDKAIESYRDALRIKEGIFGKESALLALDCLNLGSAYRRKGEFSAALEWMAKAQSLAKGSPDRQQTVNVAASLGRLFYDLKKYPESRKALQAGIDVVEEARTSAGTGKAEISARNLELYYLAAKASAALGDAKDVFFCVESAKARGYLDRISLAAALDAAGVAGIAEKDRRRMLEVEDRLGKLADWQMQEMFKPESQQDKQALLSVAGETKDLEAEFAKLDKAMMEKPGYRELRRPALATLKEAQGSLGPGEALIEYLIFQDGKDSFARCLVVKRDSASLVDLDPSVDYASAPFEWNEAVSGGSAGKEALASRLYDALIRPLERQLSGVKRLIIVPDRALAFMPFDALRKDGSAPYLCQSYQLSLAPSASVLRMAETRKAGQGTGEWLGIGGVPYGSVAMNANNNSNSNAKKGRGIALSADSSEKTKAYYAALGEEAYFGAKDLRWNDLPGAKREVEEIAKKAFGGKGSAVILGEGASEAAVKALSESGELAKRKIVHFACHAFFDAEYPQYSALALAEAGEAYSGDSAETGYLTVEEIARLKLKAELVALSACETAKGRGYYGEGLTGFARSFLVAGANGVLATLWPIDDAATREFMVRWYSLIRSEGMDFAQALAQVKREFAASKKYSDPTYWSGFVLYGR